MMASKAVDEFTGRMFEAINGMLLNMLAADAAGKRRVRQKPRQRAITRAVQRTPSAMPALCQHVGGWRVLVLDTGRHGGAAMRP
jgi:hypothetical protein